MIASESRKCSVSDKQFLYFKISNIIFYRQRDLLEICLGLDKIGENELREIFIEIGEINNIEKLKISSAGTAFVRFFRWRKNFVPEKNP